MSLVSDHCKYLSLFADTDEKMIAEDPSIDEDLLDYYRTAASFAVVTIFVMILGLVFTVYTFLNPRYMFKRLAGGIHFITGLSSAIVCHGEMKKCFDTFQLKLAYIMFTFFTPVMLVSVRYQKEHLSYAFPETADFT